MVIKVIKTKTITAGTIDLISLIDISIKSLEENSVVAITSKVVSLCENNVVPIETINKDELVIRESDLYLPPSISKYGHRFTIRDNTIVGVAGIDESNGNGNYVLWPENSQKTANKIREYFKKRFGLSRVGVIITDSTSHPLRRGTVGITLAHSGFLALNNYVGKSDLFGRLFKDSQADVAGGLAAAAVLNMGEGIESTPIAIITNVPFVQFQDRNPNHAELKDINILLEDDLFAPFLKSVKWKNGHRKTKS